MSSLRLGIIGCGLIGQKRAVQCRGHQVVSVTDVDAARAEKLAASLNGCQVAADARELVSSDVDAVIVATTHDQLAGLTIMAMEAGRHVLVEKPVARTLPELEEVCRVAERTGVTVKVGYNHRYHPALLKAREIYDSGVMGSLMFIRGRYGHGGRIGYDKEWRAVKEISGGGEMIDQGSHLVDLSRWFLGDFSQVSGVIDTCFWDMDVEDNAFMTLRTEQGQTAFLHATWTEWKNMFSMEIYGRTGKIQIDGLGGSYGTEQLTYYQMLPEMGPPLKDTYTFDEQDLSWQREMDAFAAAVATGCQPPGNLSDALAVMQVINQIYTQDATS